VPPGKGEALSKLTGLALAAALLFLSTDLSAFRVVREAEDGSPIRWKAPQVTYLINPSGGPPGSVEAIRAAMRTWNAVSGSGFTFEDGGTTALTAGQANDGANVISFAPLGGSVAACVESDFETQKCLVSRNSIWIDRGGGEIIESDIVFNTDFPWSTTDSPDAVDVETTALHELGHSLFLADVTRGQGTAGSSDDPAKAMFTGTFPLGLIKRTLHQDDMDGVSALYPGWQGW
jgi:hypothetical protein